LINYIENLEKIENCCSKYPQEKILKKKLVIKNEDMPNILYPTNIEQLLRNPYGFFFRKILGIRKEFDIFSDVGQAEFGKIIHEFIEIITKTNSEPSKIIEDIFDKKNIPSANRNLWKDSIMVLSEKIVNLNQNVRINNGEIFCEQIGKIKIDSIPNLEIAAIADRIEIYESKIVIADFKTGSVPSFVDVASSKSPQLIIEAIILVNNGFEGILYQNQEIELVFYKLKTSDPYIEPKRKTISYEEIIEHQRGLVEFLNYYYKNEKSVFNIESMPDFWKQAYDDYQYLNRYSPL
jgi:ATP-dependent helicase/nuclease subunit B